MAALKGVDHAAEIARAERLARMMDSRFSLFGIRFGWDAIFGLVPGLGDLVVVAPSAMMIWRAHRLGLPRSVIVRMAGNTALDYVLGSVPVLGDIFDVAFKANLRNAGLMREGLRKSASGGA
ncbi:DUF4112 domain-containing protein [Oceaniglobus trochenteri]|uniref:DUF4112 domain-containing protein n=1 Tax=Oceaniglobus trochenteri TaxID=2763260 RepID=UPI001CFFF27C|nr:DUF4112 domain-containing protein [Oceaniglobus trochenteri]